MSEKKIGSGARRPTADSAQHIEDLRIIRCYDSHLCDDWRGAYTASLPGKLYVIHEADLRELLRGGNADAPKTSLDEMASLRDAVLPSPALAHAALRALEWAAKYPLGGGMDRTAAGRIYALLSPMEKMLRRAEGEEDGR